MEKELGVQQRLIEMLPESLISWVGDNLLLTSVLVLGIGGFTIIMLIIYLAKKFPSKGGSSGSSIGLDYNPDLGSFDSFD